MTGLGAGIDTASCQPSVSDSCERADSFDRPSNRTETTCRLSGIQSEEHAFEIADASPREAAPPGY
jgi:hypothetical protein